MSHRFPKYPLVDTPAGARVPDVDDMNANFYEISEELTGGLNEHNWDEASSNGLTISHLATDLFVWHNATVYQAIDGHTDTSPAWMPTGGNWVKIPYDPQWRTITGMTQTFTATGGLLWILASWQLRPEDQQLFRDAAIEDVDDTPCPSFALRLNGNVLAESTLGTVESSTYAVPGLSYGVWPQATAIVVSIPAGVHTVDLVARTGLDPKRRDPDNGSDAIVANAWVGSRELIILEMRR